ncbi:hypothetical protein DLAC_11003 [Tieghemostelium lacteum]|uniref:Uncharacterized protein n=1 Tax=Tieghemostelium lacteum TaxID=361077 RepID=A0A151Z309_TIELA|nr:hypothetical protein DLAC_11003 [Tieghemostelium lacteum]|eukprot:KYQ88307.1 hypothetical protein DLAC_11003 [Tieghemostelium lacteum]
MSEYNNPIELIQLLKEKVRELQQFILICQSSTIEVEYLYTSIKEYSLQEKSTILSLDELKKIFQKQNQELKGYA